MKLKHLFIPFTIPPEVVSIFFEPCHFSVPYQGLGSKAPMFSLPLIPPSAKYNDHPWKRGLFDMLSMQSPPLNWAHTNEGSVSYQHTLSLPCAFIKARRIPATSRLVAVLFPGGGTSSSSVF